MEKEIWKDIEGYEGFYQVSNKGKVRSLFFKNRQAIIERKKELRLGNDKDGYLLATLSHNNKTKTFRVHRLVALHFIPNHDNKPQVNHINGKKNDNRVINLEWCTASENSKHRCQTLNIKPLNPTKGRRGKLSQLSKKVMQYDLNNNFIKTWYCILDIERTLGINKSSISKCCNNKQRYSGGYIWRFCD